MESQTNPALDVYNELVNSHAYVLPKNNKHIVMPHPKDVVRTFMGALDIDLTQLHIQLGKPQINIIGVNEETGANIESKAYTSYILNAKMSDYDYGQEGDEGYHYGNVGIVVNLSGNEIKVFAGQRASACLNLMVFGADTVFKSTAEDLAIYNPLIKEAHSVFPDQYDAWVYRTSQLKKAKYDIQGWDEKIGFFLRTMPTRLFPFLTHAMKQIRDEESLYYNWENSDWKLFSAMTDAVKKKSPTTQLEDTMAIQKLFNI